MQTYILYIIRNEHNVLYFKIYFIFHKKKAIVGKICFRMFDIWI